MPNFTTYLKLTKPLQQEVYDVDVFNSNCDKIDAAYKKDIDALQTHKTQTILDHPDESVTTAKLADKSVTPKKLSDDLVKKLNNDFVKKTGDNMTGNLTFETTSSIIIKKKEGSGSHTIGDGGSNGGNTNLDIGSYMDTPEANLCCYDRPGWWGENKQKVWKPFLTIPDISVTYGNINDGGILPIPEGFAEDECQWLLSIDQSNPDGWYLDIREGGPCNMINFECWRNGRTVHVGVRYRGVDGLSKNYASQNQVGVNGSEIFISGRANYICIAVKKA